MATEQTFRTQISRFREIHLWIQMHIFFGIILAVIVTTPWCFHSFYFSWLSMVLLPLTALSEPGEGSSACKCGGPHGLELTSPRTAINQWWQGRCIHTPVPSPLRWNNRGFFFFFCFYVGMTSGHPQRWFLAETPFTVPPLFPYSLVCSLHFVNVLPPGESLSSFLLGYPT